MATSLKESTDGLTKSWATVASLHPFFQGQKIEIPGSEDKIATIYDGNLTIVNVTNGSPVFELLDSKDDNRETITCFSLHPTKNEVVVATSKFAMLHYDMNTKEVIRTIRGHNMPILSMHYDTTGTLLATGSADRTVRVWDVEKGYCTHIFRDHTDVVNLVKFHPVPSKMLLFSASDDKTVRVYNLMEKNCAATFRDHFHSPTSLVVSPDGNMLISVSRDKVVNFYNLESMSTIKTLPVMEEIESAVVLSDKHSDALLSLLDSDYKQQTASQKKSGKKSKELVILSDDKVFVLVTAGESGSLKVFKVSFNYKNQSSFLCEMLSEVSLGFAKSTDTSTNVLQSLLYLPERAELLVATSDLNIHIFSISAEKNGINFNRHITGGADDILDIVNIPHMVHEDSEAPSVKTLRVAVVSNSPNVRVYDKDFSCSMLHGHEDIVLAACASPDGRYLITSSKDRHCKVWDLVTMSCVADGQGHTDSISSVAVNQRTSTYQSKLGFILSGGMDKVLKRYSFQPQKLPGYDDFESCDSPIALTNTHSIRAHDKDVNTIAVSPNDALIATGSQDKTIKIWNSQDLTAVAVLTGHRRGVWRIAFSPVDRCLVSCSGDRTVKIWSMADFKCLTTLEGHTASVLNVVFVNRGMQLVSSTSDGLLRLWTIRTGECEKIMDKHGDRVWALTVAKRSDFEDSSLVSFVSNEGMDTENIDCEDVFLSGGSDSVLHVWKDVTKEEEESRLAKEEEMLVMEQNMINDIRNKRFYRAFRAALELNHASKVYFVLSSILEEEDESTYLTTSIRDLKCQAINSDMKSKVDSRLSSSEEEKESKVIDADVHLDFSVPIMERLDVFVHRLMCDTKKTDSEDNSDMNKHIIRLVNFVKEWNTNAKYCMVSQSLLSSLLRVVKVENLTKLKGVYESMRALLSYNEKHYQRLDKLVQASYLLDYLSSMMSLYSNENNLTVIDDIVGKKKAKKKSELVNMEASDDDDEDDAPVLFFDNADNSNNNDINVRSLDIESDEESVQEKVAEVLQSDSNKKKTTKRKITESESNNMNNASSTTTVTSDAKSKQPKSKKNKN